MRLLLIPALLALSACTRTVVAPPPAINIDFSEIRKPLTYTELEVKPMSEKETISYIGSLYTTIDKLNLKVEILIDTLEKILGNNND